MDITIVGGGVCGLALAHELAPDHRVTVLESSPGPRGGGYMIDFFGPGFLAAERMGVIEELRRRGHVFDGVRYGLPDGSTSGTIDAAPLVKAAGGRYFSILRPEVELGLLAQLPESVDLRYGVRVVGVREDETRDAEAHDTGTCEPGTGDAGTREDGTEGTATPDAAPGRPAVITAEGEVLESDLVVACDGVRSPLREHVAPGHGRILPMGYRAASYLFDDAQLAHELGQRMLMTDTIQRVGWLYAADAEQVGVMFTERVDPHDTERPSADPERLRRRFTGLHPQLDRALEHAPDTFYDDLVAQSYAPRWSRGRIVLAGDAAHAPSLLAGQGASLAIAGAEALARSLRATGPHVEAGLAEYERRWRPTADAVRRSGRLSASAFIPATTLQLRLQQVARRAIGLPGVSRLLSRQFIAA
ncbi:2-polyprenyl-6-methoxyphenol hydroxylase [Brachybacterium sp. JB7]|uniref:2-polyprenyl-6-methoxyphenol hydroxylase n=2 Tax=Brachybacterium alimentarium TaxID=47845 RepID=A0A2A3YP13_9MICO|nr:MULTISPECIES: FAD-dependent monooxygenase [Brachybacterium]PCC31357.1 2-polyprenyl-6-methoxyphenol hydroxylase [Brachybacterium alimentarium]PCC40989.1 2-polyprenyl-6-methoxyphenol hydroxylase [Brachybacterium alimentarium]RCS57818.1 2-polyprenyl-6-methoxyphenol hydroxylase [Brachybacterium sp. JB7]RCS65353.1 2-polyprenyl-6-methoxyphenol hydroxylase [Brachybacterium alimentarium]RCS65947.1 2-polyprenyl-6-methoxyphenol hydroxylase [Brachybacterium alimentarium]